ncbi:MAG: endonuclease V [Weeksellaceae bacterium]
MILAVDVSYRDQIAKAAAVGFEDWTDDVEKKVWTEIMETPDEYHSGEFYKRELPCILSLLNQLDLRAVDVILIDGFVYLDDDDYPGLGGHLYECLDRKIPIIGVAKSDFVTVFRNKREIFRGESRNPIYVSAAGIDVGKAADLIQSMAGNFRIPDLLKRVDLLSKE